MSSLLGRLLRGIRAGEKHLLWHAEPVQQAPAAISLTSSAFENGAAIPIRYAGKSVGQNICPPLRWSNAPQDTVEFLLIMEDPDAPLPRPVVHLLVTEIPASLNGFDGSAPEGIQIWKGTLGHFGYAGPRPVPGHGPHKYVFQILALNAPVALQKTPSRRELAAALSGKVIARGRLDGYFER